MLIEPGPDRRPARKRCLVGVAVPGLRRWRDGCRCRPAGV